LIAITESIQDSESHGEWADYQRGMGSPWK